MPDVWVSLAFSWSALLWVITAPKWARLSDRRGRKQLMSVGVIGFISSMGMCGLVLWLGLAGLIGPVVTFVLFALFRSLYGGFGSAAPPAVQAYVAARTERAERTKALSTAGVVLWRRHRHLGRRPRITSCSRRSAWLVPSSCLPSLASAYYWRCIYNYQMTHRALRREVRWRHTLIQLQ